MQNFEDFKNVKVLVVGDVMLDQYWWGDVTRISPEAPVPVVALDKKSSVAGGAANVAVNVKGLGATPFLVGIIGQDKDANELKAALRDQGISSEHLLRADDRPTTVKTRIVAGTQQVVRVDQENSQELTSDLESSVLHKIETLLDKSDIVVISDYAKGLISNSLAEQIILEANKRKLLVLVDPKGIDYGKYKNASILTPNEKEALNASGFAHQGVHTVEQAGKSLYSDLELQYLVITRGKDGMMLFSKNSRKEDLETNARRVYDVTGAGDTVISVLAVSMGAGRGFNSSCRLANEAAGIVVEKVGTTPINIAELAKRSSTNS